MRLFALLPTVLAASAVASGNAQNPRIITGGPGTVFMPGGRGFSWNDQPRAVIGVTTSGAATSRDTLGVFVMGVADGSPAAKAGIEEGSRIASINGVDVRTRRSNDDDEYVFRTSNISRLEREVGKVKPGDDVELRVYYNGQYRNVR